MGRPKTSAPLRPQRGMAADNNSAETLTRYTFVTDGARPDHGVLARSKYDLMVQTGTAVDPADTGDLGSKDGHKATRGTAGQA